ncbi:Rv3654c family TadE-like protein [Corynebacterium guangdongense]|uniref:Secretion/DNA translocation related TadE-like protein n=1 Tax=Corynebacterium guangdongense TaxID=1783348 RepID=A0ABU2A0W2_9CORY|nr:Rv3654c family TadE-like protein [Corynebacterium guangdongense]MDR7330824.1 secretion/DNA translocation related TadE-like protein [Corynebacterium guangdongense]WJZ16839.1 hypothetical protein CGUA_01190 [Corynebacterium guangdongense]
MTRARHLLADDSGSATLVTVGFSVALASLLLVMVHAYSQVRDQQLARTAADLAAVAGAWAHSWGEPACATAREFAEANGAKLVDCRLDKESGDVTVTTGVGTREAAARAGPI